LYLHCQRINGLLCFGVQDALVGELGNGLWKILEDEVISENREQDVSCGELAVLLWRSSSYLFKLSTHAPMREVMLFKALVMDEEAKNCRAQQRKGKFVTCRLVN
jgi:hypothetical protein